MKRKKLAEWGKRKQLYRQVFGNPEQIEAIYFAPGRINIIGEHIDYTGGTVMPCAISKGVSLVIAENDVGKLRFYSCSFPETGVYEIPVAGKQAEGEKFWLSEKTGKWFDYPLSVFQVFADSGLLPDGLFSAGKGRNFFYWSDLPEGAGFSSSAAIEVATALALQEARRTPMELALLCCRAENEYIGVQCGIMDQFAVAFGKKDKAIVLNTDTLEYAYAPLALPGARLIAVNTNKSRSLADSDYNSARRKSSLALQLLQKAQREEGQHPVPNLCQLTEQQLEERKPLLKAHGVYKTARHMIQENSRTLQAKAAVMRGDVQQLGMLLQESHRSLKEDLGVSCFELDVLAESANAMEGVFGARMMGGGFGGCILALVAEKAVNTFTEKLSAIYTEKTGRSAAFYSDLEIADGAGVIKI